VRVALLVGLAVVAGFLGLFLWTTSGHFVAQVSDLYVVAQYAKAMAEGHPFRYNPGEAPTSGATSLLHTAILALAHAGGARGEGLVAFAILLGAALYLASIPLAARVARRLAGEREGLLAALLVALSGPVVWGYLYGSDIALFLFLALLLLDRWLAWWSGASARGLAAAGTLVALARPEGLPIAIALGAVSLRRPSRPRRERLLPWAPLAAALLVLALQRALTGSWLQTSVGEKALWPNYGPVETLAAASKYGVDVLRGLLLGLYPAEVPIGFSQGQAPFFFPPLALVLVLIAAVRPPAPLRLPVRAWLAVVALVFALAGPNVFMGVHFNRYLMWAFPGLLALAAVGLGVATRLLARDDAGLERGLFRAGAGLFLLLGLLSTARFAAFYSEMAGETWRREIPMAAWIRASLPPGVAIANAATSVEYLTGHRNLNLHGVTSPDFVGNRTAEREAGLFESLRRLPAAERPGFLLLARSGFEGSELLRALAEPPPLFETASLGDDLQLYRARWDLLDRGRDPVSPEAVAAVAGLRETDRIDVCDARDESAHGYRYESRLGELMLAGSVGIGPRPGGELPLADAGRLIVGSESFRVRSHAGRDLVVVLRTRSPVLARAMRAQGGLAVPVEVSTAGLVVRTGGREVRRLALSNRPGWNEHVFRVPAEAVAEGTTGLELSGRYAAFHYWFYQ
jgi:4-amino-4-deoxy-L-arabinose transferase-like glycosyltransferase